MAGHLKETSAAVFDGFVSARLKSGHFFMPNNKSAKGIFIQPAKFFSQVVIEANPGTFTKQTKRELKQSAWIYDTNKAIAKVVECTNSDCPNCNGGKPPPF